MPLGSEGRGARPARALDRWLASRTAQFVRDTTDAYERYWTPDVTEAFEQFVDDLSNWYIRRSRRRFWDGDATALRALWEAITVAIRVISPVMPFLAEHLWRNLVSGEESVFLAPWPEPGEIDEALLEEVAQVRAVVTIGRQARDAAGLKHRQPLPKAYVRGAKRAQAHEAEIKDELRVKEIEFDTGPETTLKLKPNLPVLGPRLGSKLRDVRAALEAGDYEELGDGRYRAAGEELGPDDVLRSWHLDLADHISLSDNVTTVTFVTELDDELEL